MKNNINKTILFFLLFLTPFFAMADDIDDGNGDGDVQDIPTAPIDDYAPLLVIAAVGVGYIALHKKPVCK